MSLLGRLARSFGRTLGVRRDVSREVERLTGDAAKADAAGDHRAAERLCRDATALEPASPNAWMGLGLALQLQDRLDEALPAFERAVALAPRSAAASYNLGRLHYAAARFEAAKDALGRALRIDPRFVDALILLAEARGASGDGAGAVAALQSALDIQPAHEGALRNLTLLLRARREYDEILRIFSRAAAAAPQSALASNGLALALTDVGRVDEALDVAKRALAEHPASYAARVTYLFTLILSDRVRAPEVEAEHLRVGRWFDAEAPARTRAFRNDRDPSRRLRIGYLSGDFRQQTLVLNFEPVLDGHDRTAVMPVAYSYAPVPDAWTERLRPQFELWREVARVDDDELARMIEADGIDILVDLSGYSGSSRMGVFARRPAPVQATYLAYICTSGLESMTHRLSDAVVDPPGERFGSEEIVRLTRSLWGYTPPGTAALEPARDASIGAAVRFGSFNRFPKISATTLAMWSSLLRAHPDARLTILTAPQGSAQERLRERFAAAAVDPDRIEFASRLDQGAYYGAFNRVDVCLDTTPYSGAATTCDALWMGVPVVTLRGATPVSRSTASILATAGLGDWIAETPEDYVRIALDLATRARTSEERRALRERFRNSPVMDGADLARHLERAYREMWREWFTGR